MSPPTGADTPVADMDAKLKVATGSRGVQQLKDPVNKQEEQDSEVMVVVLAKKQAAPPGEKPHMDPHLLALASSGSFEELKSLLGSGISSNLVIVSEERGDNSGKDDDDIEANKSILEGITAEGDTALHVVAASGQGDNLFTSGERHELLTTYGYGDSDNFLESARIIYGKAKHLLFVQNNKGDTPLHCAARAGKSKMAACLIEMAEGEDRMEELLRKENKHKETALSEAVRVGNKDIVDLLIGKDSELASYPEDGGASPMYLAFEQRQDEIVEILYHKSSPGKLSFSGPNGQNALHAAVLRCRAQDITNLLKWNEAHLCPQNKDLTTQRDENGSTPLHYAAAVQFIKFMIPFGPLGICRQVLEANADALYQPDHAGFFPIHVAASVGASWNVDMFIKRYPCSAGLRDAKGRTFLHVAVEKEKANVIRNACSNLSLSWIMNMVDNDGNTALHLAIEAGSLQMVCLLLANPRVNLNLPNSRGQTPLDIVEHKIPLVRLVLNNKDIGAQISSTLTAFGAVKGVHRQDHLLEVEANGESSKEMEELKDSTGTVSIGSVLIATFGATFGATFAVPGGYIADDHNNGGSPILARRYAFDAFIMSNTLAFCFSMVATIFLMRSGNSLFNLWSRKTNLVLASYYVSMSVTCLVAAFALAAYVVLVPVAHDLSLLTCAVTWSILLYNNQSEFIWTRLLLLKPLCRRNGLIRACGVSARAIMGAMIINYWPLMLIFGVLSARQQLSQFPKIEAPAPAPLAST